MAEIALFVALDTEKIYIAGPKMKLTIVRDCWDK